MTKLLLATRNRHKVDEIQSMLGGDFTCLSLREFPDAPVVVEDAHTFEGNARKKAEGLAGWFLAQPTSPHHQPDYVLADDSGLEVDALEGAPGVHSARFAASDPGGAGNSPDEENNAKLLRLLQDVPSAQRTARFRCVLALTLLPHGIVRSASPVCYADEFEAHTELYEGVCEGRIGFEAHGEHGFGYDPLFLPDGFQQTFAQLGGETKNQISHRSKALARLRDALRPNIQSQ